MGPPSSIAGLASIIIPCWNQLEFTQQCLAALMKHTRRPWELIVIDNGSTDATGAYLAGVRDMAAVPVRWTDLTVRRTGYVDKSPRARKLERDIKVLRCELEDRPDDPFVLFNLGAIAIERREGGLLGVRHRKEMKEPPGERRASPGAVALPLPPARRLTTDLRRQPYPACNGSVIRRCCSNDFQVVTGL
jgi:hypothetical protein